MESLKPVDHSAIGTNQAAIILLLVAAFLFNFAALAGLVSAVMLSGAVLSKPGFGFIYYWLLRPARWIQPEVIADNPEPHRFAQGLGGIFVLAGYALLVLGNPVVGWALCWLVVALAALNLFGGFCVGCFVYYQLSRLRLPGFGKLPPAGNYPGLRPKKERS